MATREVFKLLVEADASGAASAIRTFAGGVERDLSKAKGDVESFGRTAVKIGATLTAAGAAGTAAFVALGLHAKSAASETAGLQRVAGGSAEQMSALRFAAQQTGVELGSLSSGFVRLAKSASTEKGADTLAAYGIAARDASGAVRPLPDLLNDVADAVANMDNGAQKDDLVTTLFGKGGTTLIPLLNRGSQGLAELASKAEKLGAVLDSKAVDSAKRLTAAQRDLSAATDALQTSLGEGVVPVLATANEALASLATGAAQAFNSLPQGVKETAGAVGVLGSSALTTGGAVLTAIGGAADGVLSLKEALSGVSFSKIAAGVGVLGALTAAAGIVAYGISEANKQTDEWVSKFVRTDAINNDLFNVENANQYRTVLQGVAEDLAKIDGLSGNGNNGDKIREATRGGPFQTSGIIIQTLFGTDNPDENATKLAEKTLESLRLKFQGLSQTNAKQLLSDLPTILRAVGLSAGETADIVNTLEKELDLGNVIGPATTNFEAYQRAVEQAAQPVVTLTDALRGLRDGIDPGELSVFNTALDQSLDPLLAANNAFERLAKAQRNAAESAEKSSTDIRNAYQRLADAKEDLDRILAGDGNNLEQESPEAQIARARARVLEANAVLLRNPTDAAAQTKKDEALADEQRAIERRQQLKRDAADRDRQVRDAQRRISDAEQGVKDAQQRQTDAQAAGQTEIRDAGLQLDKALRDVAEGVQNGAIRLDDVGTYLQGLVDTGILPQSSVDDLQTRFGNIITQAGLVADALENLAKAASQPKYTPEQWSWYGGGDARSRVTPSSGRQGSANSLPAGAGGDGSLTAQIGLSIGLGDNPLEMNGQATSDRQGRPWHWNAKRQRWEPEFKPAARATGGVGFAGNPYIHSEFGMESFRPSGRNWAIPLTTGTFLSAGRTRDAMANATSAAGGDSTVIHVHEQRSPRLTAQAVVREQRAANYRRGRV